MKISKIELRRLIREAINKNIDIDVDTKLEEIPPRLAPEDIDYQLGIDRELERERNIPPDPYGIAGDDFYEKEDAWPEDIPNHFNPGLAQYSDRVDEGWFGFGKTEKAKQKEKLSQLQSRYGDQLKNLKLGIEDEKDEDPLDNIETSIDDMTRDLGFDVKGSEEISLGPLSYEEKLEKLKIELEKRKLKRKFSL